MINAIKIIIIFFPAIILLLMWIICLRDEEIDISFYNIIIGAIWSTLIWNSLYTIIFMRNDKSIENIPAVKYELITTQFNSEISGRFYLRNGRIDNEEYMYYTIKDGNELKRDKTDDYAIFISDEEAYVIIEETIEVTHIKSWLYGIDEINEELINKKSTFYIPENSIVQDISLE